MCLWAFSGSVNSVRGTGTKNVSLLTVLCSGVLVLLLFILWNMLVESEF